MNSNIRLLHSQISFEYNISNYDKNWENRLKSIIITHLAGVLWPLSRNYCALISQVQA